MSGEPIGLATKARAQLLEADLAASYAKGVEQLDACDWTGAEATLSALLDRQAATGTPMGCCAGSAQRKA